MVFDPIETFESSQITGDLVRGAGSVCEPAWISKALMIDFLKKEARDQNAISLRHSAGAPIMTYTLSHWEGLTRFIEDGRIEIDTNTVERTMRPIGLGRKNHLFAGSSAGGRIWSILASLINTAKLNEIDPQDYLTDILERIVSGRAKINELHELLPWAWKTPCQPSSLPAAA